MGFKQSSDVAVSGRSHELCQGQRKLLFYQHTILVWVLWNVLLTYCLSESRKWKDCHWKQAELFPRLDSNCHSGHGFHDNAHFPPGGKCSRPLWANPVREISLLFMVVIILLENSCLKTGIEKAALQTASSSEGKNIWFLFPLPLKHFYIIQKRNWSKRGFLRLGLFFVNRILNNTYCIFYHHYYFSYPWLSGTDVSSRSDLDISVSVVVAAVTVGHACPFYHLLPGPRSLLLNWSYDGRETASWHFTCLHGYRQLWTLLTTSWGRKLWNPGKTWIPRNKRTPPQCYWTPWRKGRSSLQKTWSSRRS